MIELICLGVTSYNGNRTITFSQRIFRDFGKFKKQVNELGSFVYPL